MFNTKRKIKFKIEMLKSSSCHYNDAYIFLKGAIYVGNT